MQNQRLRRIKGPETAMWEFFQQVAVLCRKKSYPLAKGGWRLLLLLNRFSRVQLCGSPVPGILQARTLKWVTISFSNAWKWKVKMKSCPTPSDPMDYSPSGSSVHGIFQARVLEWGAIAFSGWLETIHLSWQIGLPRHCPRCAVEPASRRWDSLSQLGELPVLGVILNYQTGSFICAALGKELKEFKIQTPHLLYCW